MARPGSRGIVGTAATLPAARHEGARDFGGKMVKNRIMDCLLGAIVGNDVRGESDSSMEPQVTTFIVVILSH